MQKRAVSDHMQKCIMDNSPFDNAVKPVYACALRFEAAQRTSGIAVHFFTSFSIVCIINYTFFERNSQHRKGSGVGFIQIPGPRPPFARRFVCPPQAEKVSRSLRKAFVDSHKIFFHPFEIGPAVLASFHREDGLHFCADLRG